MSERTTKAIAALTEACRIADEVLSPPLLPPERIRHLLEVASIQAAIASAEALETQADYYRWLRQCSPLGPVTHYPAPQQVTPFKPWTGPTSYPEYHTPNTTPATWAERSGLDNPTVMTKQDLVDEQARRAHG